MTRPVDPVETFHEVRDELRQARVLVRFDDEGRQAWEPPTYEEASAAASILTTYIANHYERKTA